MRLPFFLLLIAASPLVQAAEPVASTQAPASPADTEYEAMFAVWRAAPPAGVEFPSRAFFKFQDQKNQEFATAARAFGEKYPTDPRRYNGWVQSSFTRPWFIQDFKPDFEARPGERNLIVDEAALATFRSVQAGLLTKVIEAPDAEERQRGGAFFALLADARGAAAAKGESFDITVYRPLVDRVAAQFGDERALPVVEQYVEGLRQKSPAEAAAYEASLDAQPAIAAALKAAAEGRKLAQEKAAEAAKTRATEISTIKFTAADGREVDVARLKGKVVLIDFWATWCGPCVAELPNVKKVYATYHDQGFEVIGITLENPNARPKDTPEQAAAKLEVAKSKMLAFAEKNQMAWPQYFDGKWWKNDYAVKFGIEAIPAMFLLGKDGKIASTNARGEKLEAEVKRLLAL